MARADLLIQLVESGIQGNETLFRETIQALIVDEKSKNHNILAQKLENALLKSTKKKLDKNISSITFHKNQDLYYEMNPIISFDSLILNSNVKQSFHELIQEHFRSDLLRSYNLEPRNRILLAGPPGNGKTSIAEALASDLMVPLITARYEGLVDSYLGETSNRLNELFNYVKTKRCVLFFDEFDTIGKERGDSQETGEIKRVVSSLLLQIDKLPSHVVVVTATNHPELLDRAVWRRFQLKLEITLPDREQIEEWLERFEIENNINLEYTKNTLIKKLEGLSFSDLNEFGLDIKRKYVLSLPNSNMKNIVKSTLENLKFQYLNIELGEEDNE
ncbi:AAA family ATPase [Bacillus glycinifermentans]|uniref:AAA family ATPase n=1 Tax=Bacillus glycinifermentans TaxID=1664069 RepID=UPI001FF32427|nr:ATP-binding protein [Bacillus glycinifermentans]UOY87395.1 ATP-binding protein [Bacillus glycinifermentans]